MGDQLLIRAYNVGCGDCIYVRIPDERDGFHILIDCGKKGSDELLQKAIAHLETQLPEGSAAGKKRLDLIVATHRHEDHIKGFDPRWFEHIEVKNIWLSVGMDPAHPQAQRVRAMRGFVTQAMRGLMAGSQALSPEVELLASMYGVSNDAADRMLMESLPTKNGIEPCYVYSDMKHDLELPPDTALHVLAPEKDVDHYYFGKELDTSLKGLQGISTVLSPSAGTGNGAIDAGVEAVHPANISETDFRLLRSRMLSNGLAFAAKESSIQNNLSVVLLIEWKRRRLLFVGDAEWRGEFVVGNHNGSWNVMWERYRTTHLKSPVDFLKIGHHGSINATPPAAETRPESKKAVRNSIYAVLDTILPVADTGKKPTAKAVVSTEREFYNPIPECKLLVDLARRVSNTRRYGEELEGKGIEPRSLWVTTKAKKNHFFEKYEQDFLAQLQPQRTDLEFALDSDHPWVDIEIEAGR